MCSSDLMKPTENAPVSAMAKSLGSGAVHELIGAATFRHKLRQFNDLLATLGEPLGVSPDEAGAMTDLERDLETRIVRHRQSLETLAEAQEALNTARLRAERLAGEYRVVRCETAARMERILADAPPQVNGRTVHRAGLRDLLYASGDWDAVSPVAHVSCPAPQNVRVAANKPGAHRMELSWAASLDAVCGFEIEAARGKAITGAQSDTAKVLPADAFVPVGIVRTLCFVHDVREGGSETPPANTPIYYRVRAINETGETSAWSEPVCAVYKAAATGFGRGAEKSVNIGKKRNEARSIATGWLPAMV